MNAAIAVLLGGGVGFGFVMVMRALESQPVPLADIVATLERPGLNLVDLAKTDPADYQVMTSWQRRLGRFGIRLIESLGFIDGGVLKEQLRVLDKSIERHAYEKVFGAVVGFMLPVVMMLVIALAGVTVSPLLGLAAAIVFAAGGFFYPDLPLTEKVEKRRQAFRHAFSSYLDLVTIILAGGGGIESALEGAAEAGDGWSFAELRNALRRARLTRRTPWEMFDELGAELGIEELQELSSSVALAGGQGAKVKLSLIAKADAMRAAQAAQLEVAAEVQTEKMIVPVVVLIIGLVLFIGYGAVDAISSPGTQFEDAPTVEIGEFGK
ncbi:MAG: type II secretion system F family protein [Gemmatimonadota bacterium]|nr:type II secretion system F family protein [Gemmatimonadota bacterium]MDH5615037.1 type II secretion system F family protein [Acidimicrobiia bacterium]